jgi:hypothetical protein
LRQRRNLARLQDSLLWILLLELLDGIRLDLSEALVFRQVLLEGSRWVNGFVLLAGRGRRKERRSASGQKL